MVALPPIEIEVTTNLAKVTSDINKLKKEFDGIDKSAKTNTQSVKNYEKSASSAFKKTTSETKKAKTESDKYSASLAKQANTFNRLKGDIKKAEAGQKLINQQYKNGTITLKQFNSELLKNQQRIKMTQTAQKQLFGSQTGSALTAAGGLGAIGQIGGALGISSGIFLAVTAATQAINVFRELDLELSKISAITQATDEDFDDLKLTIEGLGASTTFTAKEIAQASTFLARTGFDAREIAQILPATLDLAIGTGSDIATSADIVSNIMKSFNADLQDTRRFVDALVGTTNSYNTDLIQLGEAMKIVAPSAKTLGLEIEEVAGLLGILGDSGIQGTLAGTGLQMMMLRLGNDTNGARQEMEKLIGESLFDARGDFKDITQILGKASEAFVELTQQEQINIGTRIGGVRGVKTMLNLLGLTEEQITQLTDAQENFNGAAKRSRDIIEDNLDGDVRRLNSAWQGLTTSLVEGVEPIMRTILDTAKEFITVINVLTNSFGFFVDLAAVSFKSIGAVIKGAVGSKTIAEELDDVRNEFLKNTEKRAKKELILLGINKKEEIKIQEDGSSKIVNIAEQEKKRLEDLEVDRILAINASSKEGIKEQIRDSEVLIDAARKRFLAGEITQEQFMASADEQRKTIELLVALYEDVYGDKIPGFSKEAADAQAKDVKKVFDEYEKGIEQVDKTIEKLDDAFVKHLRGIEKDTREVINNLVELEKGFLNDLAKTRKDSADKIKDIEGELQQSGATDTFGILGQSSQIDSKRRQLVELTAEFERLKALELEGEITLAGSIEREIESLKIIISSRERNLQDTIDQFSNQRGITSEQEEQVKLYQQLIEERKNFADAERLLAESPEGQLAVEALDEDSDKSIAQRKDEEFQLEKARLEERKTILEALKNDEIIDIETIKDFKNQEFLREEEFKKLARETERQEVEAHREEIEETLFTSISKIEDFELASIATRSDAYNKLIDNIRLAMEELTRFNQFADAIDSENQSRANSDTPTRQLATPSSILTKFHDGGLIEASTRVHANLGAKAGEVPIMAQKGEFVVKKSATKNNAELLSRINAGVPVDNMIKAQTINNNRTSSPSKTLQYSVDRIENNFHDSNVNANEALYLMQEEDNRRLAGLIT